MFKTITKTTYIFPVKEGLSWALQQKVLKHLNKRNKNVSVDYATDNSGIRVSIENTVIPEATLNYIDVKIPEWVNEIKENEKKEYKEDIIKIKNFLADYKDPVIPADHIHAKALRDFLKVIKDQVADVRRESKKSKPEIIYALDAIDYIKIFNCIVEGNLKVSYRIYRDLDTCAREIVPDSVHEIWD
jgi:hypothetical protein